MIKKAQAPRCPSCAGPLWETVTESGTIMKKCQGCGKAWAEMCPHTRGKRAYVTAGGEKMEQCKICGKRWKSPTEPEQLAHDPLFLNS